MTNFPIDLYRIDYDIEFTVRPNQNELANIYKLYGPHYCEIIVPVLGNEIIKNIAVSYINTIFNNR